MRFQADGRKEGFQLFLVDSFRSPLLTGTVGKGIQLLKNVFHIAPSFEIHIEVSRTHIGTGGIHRSSEAHKEVLGLEIAFRSTDRSIGHRGIDHVFLLQIAHKRHFELMRGRERCLHELHHLPVELGYLHGEVSRHVVGFQLGIKASIDFHGGVPRFKGGIKLMVFQRCGEVVTRQAVVGIMDFVHSTLHVEISFGQEEIQSLAIGMEIHRDLVKRVFWKKLMHVEIIYHEIRQISLLTQIILGIKSGGTAHLEILRQGKGIVVHGKLSAVHQGLCPRFRLLQE